MSDRRSSLKNAAGNGAGHATPAHQSPPSRAIKKFDLGDGLIVTQREARMAFEVLKKSKKTSTELAVDWAAVAASIGHKNAKVSHDAFYIMRQKYQVSHSKYPCNIFMPGLNMSKLL